MFNILDGLASDQDAVSSVFFGAVGDGSDLHCVFLEHERSITFGKYARKSRSSMDSVAKCVSLGKKNTTLFSNKR